ncbi:MAG TPA: DUF2207 domain-containing protein, partial [Propionibacteriaceae bacterium]|nr:DUF2207 domain-containing protein [Propionibacteriaceae bacterium]
GLVVASPQASAASNWKISRYHSTVTLATDGLATVVVDFDFDFGNESGHGPYVLLPFRQGLADDPDRWRDLTTKVVSITSGTGAPVDLKKETQGSILSLRIGDEDKTVRGVQNYVVTYTARGFIEPNQATSGLDEFNWNAVGEGWEVPLNNVSVDVTGPAAIRRTACFAGTDYSGPCTTTSGSGNTAHFEVAKLNPGQGMQVVAGFPKGTFVGAEPTFSKRYRIGNMFPVTPVTAGLTALLSALGLGWVVARVRRNGRDEVYLGMTPGVIPGAGQAANVGHARAPEVAVAFRPPAGATPGEIGTLIDAKADNVDVTAMIIDLAVRGHMKIDQQGKKDFTFRRLQSADRPSEGESKLLAALFKGHNTVTSDDLKDKSYAKLLSDSRADLYEAVMRRGWFRRKPETARMLAYGLGILLIIAAVLSGGLLGLFGFGFLGVAALVTGFAVLGTGHLMPARTADGSAVLAQTKGFELYLRTAEADQIKFEEGIDVFSRYLPYAIVFGVAERWVKVFERLAAEGLWTPTNTWYTGPNGYIFYPGFASSMDGLTSAMSSSLHAAEAAASAGSGGGSGFSGGGGFGGGGGGGW